MTPEDYATAARATKDLMVRCEILAPTTDYFSRALVAHAGLYLARAHTDLLGHRVTAAYALSQAAGMVDTAAITCESASLSDLYFDIHALACELSHAANNMIAEEQRQYEARQHAAEIARNL